MRVILLVFIGIVLALAAQEAHADLVATTRPVPDAASIKDASATVDEVYANDLKSAKSPEQKRALVRKLLDAANDEKGASRYALLAKARDLALDAGDIADCDAVLAGIEASFDVDSLSISAEAYSKISQNLGSPSDRKKLCIDVSSTVRAALAKEQFVIAKSEASLELNVARRTDDAAITEQAVADMQAVTEMEVASADAGKAERVLKIKPTDADANLTTGKYACFMKGDWATGLPMLALGSDATLKGLASQEIEGAAAVDDQVKLGDNWWDAAQKMRGRAKVNLQAHAADWYRQALTQMDKGLARTKVEQRLQQYSAPAAGSEAPPIPDEKPSLMIVKAIYGADSGSVDVTEQLTAAVNDLGLIVTADNSIAGSPAPNVVKHLTVSCTVRGQPILRTVQEGDLLVLLTPAHVDQNGTIVVRAVYGAGCKWNEVTSVVQTAMDNNEKDLKASSKLMGGDPVFGAHKYCVIIFAVDGQTAWKAVREGDPITFPLQADQAR